MDTKILDEIKSKRINPETLKDMSEDDKTFFYLNAGIMYVSALNTIDRGIREHERMIRMIIPEPIEDIKILLSRIADIKQEEIKDLSSGFLQNLFTINDKTLKITFPEVGEVDETEFKRIVVEQIKNSDAEVASANEIKKEIIKQFEEDIPADRIVMLKDPIAMDDWVIDYFKKQAARDDISKEQKEDFVKKLEAKNKSYTLEPLKNSITNVINTKNNSSSIIHGFRYEHERILKSAIKTCHAANITFPFQLFTDIENLLFGDKYNDYKNLLLFLWARYLKYVGSNITDSDKIFITNFHTHLVMLKRSDDWKKNANFNIMKNAIEDILDTVINNIPKNSK